VEAATEGVGVRRIGRVLAACALLVLVVSCASHAPVPSRSLEFATLDPVKRVTSPPDADVRRSVYATSRLSPSPMLLNLCRGPIAIDLGPDRPVLVAEHDYCGGRAWIPQLEPGDAVALTGDGVEDGTYLVTDISTERRGEAQVGDLPAADVVLQTCISPGEMVLVAANRFVPALQN
jgi:hypothetical protein